MEILEHEKQIHEYIKTIEHLKKQDRDTPLFKQEVQRMEAKLEELKKEVYSNLNPWQRVQICRHPARPHTVDYIKNLCEDFSELSGDRTFSNDESIIGGLAKIGGQKVVIIGQEKGNDTESRIKRNFGYMRPEGYRKALRLMRLAEKFSLPIVSLIDTPGAYPGLDAEERGIGWAIAENLRDMSVLKTPIVTVIIGEGSSGGALGIGIGDTIGMLEHAYYSVITPEGCASILWKDPTKNQEAASILKLNAEDMLEMEIIDEIIPEPLGGAQYNPSTVYENVKRFIAERATILKKIRTDILVEQRYLKFRKLGKFIHAEPL